MLRLVAICTISAGIYGYGLDRVPAFLTLDEAHFSVHAHAIAETGRNLNGQVLPMLIGLSDPEGEPIVVPWGETYYLPFGVYLIAGALQVLPLTEAAVRLPSAMLGGVVNVALIFAAALALFRDQRAAICSAALLALTPANVIISRQAVDSVCQLPFTLGFLWCLGMYLQRPHPRLALASGAILGLGVHAYVTSVVFMPFFLALFWLVAWRTGALDRRAWLWSMAGFAVGIVPMIAWLFWHPDVFISIREQYNRADPGSTTLMYTAATSGSAAAARESLRIYWSYFDPAFLFVQGGNTRTLSTGEIGVFLAPVVLLAPLGIRSLRDRPVVRWLLLIGLLAAPLPAVIKGAVYQIQRASGLLIFVSLLSGAGYASLWASRRMAANAAAIAIALMMVLQFGGFYRDYLDNYRIRSAHWFDPTAFRGAAEAVIREDQHAPVTRVYLPSGFYDAGAKWRFYTIKHSARGLFERTEYYTAAAQLAGAAAGSVAIIPVSSEIVPALPGWRELQIVRNLMGTPTAIVLRRELS
jgi:4-amino-4-deoxy-L-arabinose transferase-like glycosyltransferase